jgi:uncharacterized protein (TIGR02118 family)
MTVKLVVLYTQPEDNDAFDRHYFDIHLPLVHRIPGLRRAETGRFIDVLDGGEQTFYRVAELCFPDQATMDAGIASDRGKRPQRTMRRSPHPDRGCSWSRSTTDPPVPHRAWLRP